MVLGFALSRTAGLPDYKEEGWEPPYGALSVVTEMFLVAFAAWYGAGMTRTPPTAVSRPAASVGVR
ncbi:hypothetical protein AB0C96_02795 [Streptomyces sp. NPDC048506]|uniref:hypothetical protein n=1 Tax=Streptomyces sp. NPDC048506 TaxID=3155028 RepID=UPI00343A8A50